MSSPVTVSVSTGPVTISKWLEQYGPLEMKTYHAVSSDIVKKCVLGWKNGLCPAPDVFAPSSSLSSIRDKPATPFRFPSTTELEGRLVVPTFGTKKLHVNMLLPTNEAMWDLQMWPSDLQLDPLNTQSSSVPELKNKYIDRLVGWVSEHWIRTGVQFVNPTTPQSAPVTTQLFDLKRWTFHGAGTDSHRIECLQPIPLDSLVGTKGGKYASGSMASNVAHAVWRVTEKRSSLSFAPVKQFILADVINLRGAKEKIPLPCQFCIHIQDEQSSSPLEVGEINAYAAKWIPHPKSRDRQQWTTGNVRLTTAAKSNNLIKLAGVSMSTPKGVGQASLYPPRNGPPSSMSRILSPPTSTPMIATATRFDFSTKLPRAKAPPLCLMEGSSMHPVPPPSSVSRGGRQLTPSPTHVWEDDSRSDFSSLISPVISHGHAVFTGPRPPSPAALSSPLAQSSFCVSPAHDFQSSSTNIQMRHADPMIRFQVGVWDVEIKSMNVLWDVTPQMVQLNKMKYGHQRQAVWEDKGTKQQLEIEIELNLSRAPSLVLHSVSDSCLETLASELLSLLCLFNVLLSELSQEEAIDSYSSPFWSRKT